MSSQLPSNGASVPGGGLPATTRPGRLEGPNAFGAELVEPTDWRRLASAVMRYRWWIVGLVVLGGLAGAAGGRLLPPRYQVQATIWIQSIESRGSTRGPIGANQLFDSYAWVDLLKSYVVLDAVARELRLYLSPERGAGPAFADFAVNDTYRPGRYRIVVDRTGGTFRLTTAAGAELQRGAVGEPVGEALGFHWTPTAAVLPAGSDFNFTVRPLRDAAQGLGNALSISMDQSGNFLRVGLTGQNPGGVATMVNAVAHRFVDVSAELKRAKLHELGQLLDDQLQAARENLRRAENALEEFRIRTATLSPDLAAGSVPSGTGSSLATLLGPTLEQEQLRRDRSAIEAVLLQVKSGRSAAGLAFIGAVQRSPEVSQALKDLTAKQAEWRALRTRYTDDHPAVQRLTGEIAVLQQTSIPVLAQSLVAELTAREGVLAPQIAAEDAELRGIPQRAIEEARRRRAVDLAGNLYTAVQQRFDEARLAEASSIADVRILDAAEAPQEPLKNAASRFLMLGLAAALGLGLAGAVLADRLDPRMRYPDQVTRQMGLPILGVLPHVKDRGARPGDQQVAHVIEAMRSVRLSLVHFYGGNGPVVFTVTSPGVGDGKSFVSANLALACAEAGQPTLLIDGDARRGSLHRVMHRPRKPGLTDCLAGAAPLATIIQSTQYPSLDFVGAGSRFGDSPELLGSPAMASLLEQVRAQYRVVVVDSPPLGSGVDPYTLGIITGSMLLVLRTGTTNLALARTKLAILDHLPIRLLGVVLNDIQPSGMYRYYSYLPGYVTADEDEGYAVAGRKARGVL